MGQMTQNSLMGQSGSHLQLETELSGCDLDYLFISLRVRCWYDGICYVSAPWIWWRWTTHWVIVGTEPSYYLKLSWSTCCPEILFSGSPNIDNYMHPWDQFWFVWDPTKNEISDIITLHYLFYCFQKESFTKWVTSELLYGSAG